MLPQRTVRRAAGDSGTVDPVRAGQPHRTHRRGRRSHRTWTRPGEPATYLTLIAAAMPTRVSRSYFYLSLSLSSSLLSMYSSRLCSPSFSLNRPPHPLPRRQDIPSRFPTAATTVIKLTVLKSDSRDADEWVPADVRIRHTRKESSARSLDATSGANADFSRHEGWQLSIRKGQNWTSWERGKKNIPSYSSLTQHVILQLIDIFEQAYLCESSCQLVQIKFY